MHGHTVLRNALGRAYLAYVVHLNASENEQQALLWFLLDIEDRLQRQGL